MRINGEALRVIRELSRYTITDLANRSGVDRTVITRIEKGERRGTPAQHLDLARALDIKPIAIGYVEQDIDDEVA